MTMRNFLLLGVVFLVMLLVGFSHPEKDYGSSYEEPIIRSIDCLKDFDNSRIQETFEFYGNCDYVYLTVLRNPVRARHTGKYTFIVIKGTSEEVLEYKTFTGAVREVERSIVNCEDLFPYNVVLIDEEDEDNQCYG